MRQVPVSDSVNRYAVDLVRATRPHDPNAPEMRAQRYVQYGASVRATMFMTLAAKARALMQGRYHVTHEDIAALALPVMRHRVLTNYFAESDGIDTDKVLTDLVADRSSRQRSRRARAESMTRRPRTAASLSPEMLAGLANLELVARAVVKAF